jgi:hypothetical protein
MACSIRAETLAACRKLQLLSHSIRHSVSCALSTADRFSRSTQQPGDRGWLAFLMPGVFAGMLENPMSNEETTPPEKK